jgi:hypothetical protein
MLNNRLRRFFNIFALSFNLKGFRCLFQRFRLWLLAFLNLFGDLNNLFSKGFCLFFAVRMFFRFDNRGGFDRRFSLRCSSTACCSSVFCSVSCSFSPKPSQEKKPRFFCFAICDYTPRGAIYMEAKKMMK